MEPPRFVLTKIFFFLEAQKFLKTRGGLKKLPPKQKKGGKMLKGAQKGRPPSPKISGPRLVYDVTDHSEGESPFFTG
ncbi:MAG: hypothetical protein Ct9H300mP21_10000 [Pseudomonadota bacterium]|nr:MAG: hypothetical protein Ct9H300mP21_10000 [Pseudomonadota bacterium]